jgi:hypothetical protein
LSSQKLLQPEYAENPPALRGNPHINLKFTFTFSQVDGTVKVSGSLNFHVPRELVITVDATMVERWGHAKV